MMLPERLDGKKAHLNSCPKQNPGTICTSSELGWQKWAVVVEGWNKGRDELVSIREMENEKTQVYIIC